MNYINKNKKLTFSIFEKISSQNIYFSNNKNHFLLKTVLLLTITRNISIFLSYQTNFMSEFISSLLNLQYIFIPNRIPKLRAKIFLYY